MYATLVDKYGKPNWSKYFNDPVPRMMSNYMPHWIGNYYYNKGRYVVEKRDSWLLEFDDCYVNIVLYKWYGAI